MSGTAQESHPPEHGGKELDDTILVPVGENRELQSEEADVVQRLVVERDALDNVLHELVEAENCFVRLHDSIGDLAVVNFKTFMPRQWTSGRTLSF